jgi:hypothetical protein
MTSELMLRESALQMFMRGWGIKIAVDLIKTVPSLGQHYVRASLVAK